MAARGPTSAPAASNRVLLVGPNVRVPTARVAVLAVAVVLAGVGSACGGSEVSGAEPPASTVPAATSSAITNPATSAPTTSTTRPWPYGMADYVAAIDEGWSWLTVVMAPAEAECFGTQMVASIGLDRLVEAEITPQDFVAGDGLGGFMRSDESREVVVDATTACVDFHQIVFAQTQLPERAAACLRANVAERDLVEIVLKDKDVVGPPVPQVADALERARTACPGVIFAFGD